MSFECLYDPGRHSSIKLTYRYRWVSFYEKDYCYHINLVEKKSNLGKGESLYFQCPVTGDLCRYLYLAYDSESFKSRKAYEAEGKRLYYSCQIASKATRYHDSFWRADSRLDGMARCRKKYAGKQTKSHARVVKLCAKLDQIEQDKWHNQYVPTGILGTRSLIIKV